MKHHVSFDLTIKISINKLKMAIANMNPMMRNSGKNWPIVSGALSLFFGLKVSSTEYPYRFSDFLTAIPITSSLEGLNSSPCFALRMMGQNSLLTLLCLGKIQEL